MELTIEKLVYGGEGLARLAPGADGRREAVFVPRVLPGERVQVDLQPRARGRRTASLLEVLEPSPERIAPGCEYFGRCGGCQLQHARPEYQLALKHEILLETLRRTGGVEWTGEVQLHAGEPWGYRNRIRVQAVPGIGVGYHEAASRRVLPITHCPIASPEINRELAAMAAEPPHRRDEFELAESDVEVNGKRYRVSDGSFFQVNRFLAGMLVDVVAESQAGEMAVDLFSGVGLFALPLTRAFTQVDAVESHPGAVDDLRHNAMGTIVQVHAVPALTYMRKRAAAPPDLMVADPPRAGLGPELVTAILAAAPARLHLVSCDPATLGRDLRPLLDAGYAVREMHLFDMFPQTYHLETVVKLGRH